MCESTALLSIHSNLFLLMAQALLSRLFVPGKSNFVNASVYETFLFQSSKLDTLAAADFRALNPAIGHAEFTGVQSLADYVQITPRRISAALRGVTHTGQLRR